jgi:hypothetical protein
MRSTRSVSQLRHEIIDQLKAMDKESTSVVEGVETALADYAVHAGMKRSLRETAWANRLAERLNQSGWSAAREQRYPGLDGAPLQRIKCDLVVTMEDKRKVWLELKPAWRECFTLAGKIERNDDGLYFPYLFGPYSNGWDKTHSAVQDLEKLESLTSVDADYTALLLLGFDSDESPMGSDVKRMIRMATLRARGWRGFTPVTWRDRRCNACRINCWLFWRKTRSKPLARTRSRNGPL